MENSFPSGTCACVCNFRIGVCKMTRREVAYFSVRTFIIAHLLFFLGDVTYFFLIKTQFTSEMEMDIMSFSQQGKIECVSIIVPIHNVILMWKME